MGSRSQHAVTGGDRLDLSQSAQRVDLGAGAKAGMSQDDGDVGEGDGKVGNRDGVR